MVILGLGSNLGDKLTHLRRALALLKKIPGFSIAQISPVYISDALVPENAPLAWDAPYLNLALRGETTLSPYELLDHLKEIEKKVGRTPEKVWGPRIIDIDLLAWDDRIQYDKKLHIPHEHLAERPFALWPLADVAPFWIYPLSGPDHGKLASRITEKWGSRFDGRAPFHTRQIAQRIDTPALVGIINSTPDSFSDGGKYTASLSAKNYARQVMIEGAEIIDVGAEATHPNAKAILAGEEWQRLEPILTEILFDKKNHPIQPKISVDTRHVETAKKALELGVDWINDVSGLENPLMCKLIAEHSCDIVMMHHLGIPANKAVTLPPNQHPVEQIFQFAKKRLADVSRFGISPERIIFDVGIGFGKTTEQSLLLLKEIKRFHELGLRLLVGHSRKSCISQFTDEPFERRDIETAALSLQLAKQNVHYLRVHHIEMHARLFKVMETMP
ncbi:MAG: Folate synthesis bifunctional protein [uncultured bacterium]|nr:MAG: Folate synthesis bifunctional protein [uncultured bacterium]